MECPYCKYENRDGVHYCSNCGRALSSGVTTNTSTGGTSRSLTVGTPLQGGRYVITKILGEGGMGAAMLATDKRLDNKPVVIKELISLAHLDHPLIPNVTDNFDEGSHYFMVQDYVEGENLEQRMERLKQPMR